MMKSRGNRSIVWQYCIKISEQEVVCKLCNKHFRFVGTTSNLNDHLRRKHSNRFSSSTEKLILKNTSPNKEDQEMASDESSIEIKSEPIETEPVEEMEIIQQDISIEPPCSAELTETNKESVNECLLKMITTQLLPLSFIENTYFIEYTRQLQSVYTPPSVDQLKSALLLTYKEMKEQTRQILCNIKHVSVTTDLWYADSMKLFLTITCHFIKDKKLHSKTLVTAEMLEFACSTIKDISAVLMLIFVKWPISNKISVITSSSQTIKDATTENLKKEQITCFASILNSIVINVITSNAAFRETVAKCKRLTTYNMLLSNTRLLQKKWTWKEILLAMKKQISSKTQIRSLEQPSFPEKNVYIDWISILTPIECLANELSKEMYPTTSIIIPLLTGLHEAIGSVIPSTEIGRELKTAMLESVCSSLNQIENNRIYAKSTFLDPRFKRIAFSNQEKAEHAQKLVVDELVLLTTLKQESDATGADIGTSIAEIDSTSIWGEFDRRVANTKVTPSLHSEAELAVKQYIRMPYIPRKENPLVFWDNVKDLLPNLYQLHLKYLCIPATCVPPKRIFMNDHEFHERRRKIPEELLDAMLFLNGNLN